MVGKDIPYSPLLFLYTLLYIRNGLCTFAQNDLIMANKKNRNSRKHRGHDMLVLGNDGNLYPLGGLLSTLQSGSGGGVLGGAASLASNAISGGMSTGVGNAMQTLGGIASNIPGIGGVIGAGVNVLGGVVNKVFGSKINEKFVADTKQNIAENIARQFDSSSIDSVLSQQSDFQDMNLVNKNDVGKDGWFSNKAKKLAKRLNKQIKFSNAYNRDKLSTAFSNAGEAENLGLLANFAAYGGQLFKNGGGIHIKKANRGKFTEYCGGKVTSECIARGKHSSSPAVRKRATFAQNARGWHHSFGGWLNTQGGDFSNGITMIGNGGTHEQNPFEGVQMGLDPQGVPNLVEEGEVVFNDYVFSNRLKVPKKDMKKFKLKGKTFADAAKNLQKESEERPNDPISKRGLEASMGRLAGIQEGVRERKSGNKFADGGKKKNYRDVEVPMAGINTDYSGQLPTRLTAPKGVTPIEEQVPDSELAPTWMRYAPVAGSAFSVLSDMFVNTNRPDYGPSDYINGAIKPIKPIGARTINNYLTYKPLDTDYMTNKLNANRAAQRRGILNTSGGNRATAMAGLIASDYNYGNQLGDLTRQAEMYNEQQRQQVQAFNRGTNQFNAEALTKADAANANIQQQQNELRLKQRLAQAQMRDTANVRSSQARSANLTNLLDNLGAVGQENFARNMIASNPALYYDLSSKGGVEYKGKNKKKRGGRLTYGW